MDKSVSYHELSRLGVTFRPIDQWAGELTRHRRRSQFAAPLGATVSLLARELRALRARLIVLQIAVGEVDLRNDHKPFLRLFQEAAAPDPWVMDGSQVRPAPRACEAFSPS